MSQDNGIQAENKNSDRNLTDEPELPQSEKTQGFGRGLRLTKPGQFQQVFEKNHRTADRYWTILFRENKVGVARLGMAVAKKRAKRAVDRNRLKRTIRESFRCQTLMPGVDIVVLPRDASVSASNDELRNSLGKHWLQIKKKCA